MDDTVRAGGASLDVEARLIFELLTGDRAETGERVILGVCGVVVLRED